MFDSPSDFTVECEYQQNCERKIRKQTIEKYQTAIKFLILSACHKVCCLDHPSWIGSYSYSASVLLPHTGKRLKARSAKIRKTRTYQCKEYPWCRCRME